MIADTPDVLVIATNDRTHCQVAIDWLKRPRQRPRFIFIEKPLDASIDAARDLLGHIPPYDESILAFDHYRARLLPAREKYDMLLGFLRSRLKRFTFYFLEDTSGADSTYVGGNVARQGPIERDSREKALRDGVILHIMPHVIALLAHFGRVETLRVTHVRAGKYVGVDGDPNKASEIDHETYAEVRFRFISIDNNEVEGQAYVGKAVKGVKKLGSDYDGNTKLLEIEGEDGRSVRFDFRDRGTGTPGTRSKARLLDGRGNCHFEFDLNSEPYYAFLENVTAGGKIDPRLGLPIETGKKILEVIQDMRHAILKRQDELITYPCRIQNVRESLYMEDLKLPLIYGVEDISADAARAR